MAFGDEIDAVKLLTALHVAEADSEDDTYIGALGESGDPIRYVEIRGRVDLGRVAEALNSLQRRQ